MSARPKKYILYLVMVGFLIYWLTACQNQPGAELSEAEEPIPLVDAETAADFPAADSPKDMSTMPLPGESSDQPAQAEVGQAAPQTDTSSQPVETKPESTQSGDPSPPAETLKLIFIHHSVGENWLADDNGGLGLALADNNFFVSDTNYGWGPDGIGDRTDIGDWLDWFQDPGNLEAVLSADENYTGNYSRMPDPDPGRVNQIILFKSCFPNSNLEGRPDDPPSPGDPTTVSGAKYVYSQLLETFKSMPDTLFVVITAPPVTEDDSWTTPANARGFNNWLVSGWLDDYSLHNVGVFDFYNTLTSNGGDIYTNDLDSDVGNHHRWWNGAVQHIQTIENDLATYPDGDSHPNWAGSQKATAEFVPLLNLYVQRWLGQPSPESGQLTPETAAHQPVSPESPSGSAPPGFIERIEHTDLAYLGAFRLPDGPPEIGWSWSGEALAYYPSGDPEGPADGFPGSLFGTGHNLSQFVSEITIPIPVNSQSKNLNELNAARTLQEFQDIRGELFPHLDFELPRAALAYLPPAGGDATGKLHFAWGQHLQDERPAPSHGWSDLDLSIPQPAGAWVIGDFSPYSVNDYLFPIPDDWAAAHLPGFRLVTGRFRDGGWSGQGPSLIAYNPPDTSTPSPAGTRLSAVPLILYASTLDSEILDTSLTLNDYHHADEWSGGAWLTAGDKQAVIIAGTKGQGDSWYGFANGVVWPDDPPYPEVPEPPFGDRGWWSTTFEGQLLLYDPDDLAAVARGEMAPYEPQPYAALNIDAFLYNVDSVQQKEHLGAVAFDHDLGLLYILEPLVDEEKPIVHVWQITG
ncbi:MAG TPA: hypothetical protein VFI27_07035 [candidate division Zixibacteria bacterium]|nr:hypothetical protein [candidate division Zixibacteria bacterium]